MEIDDIQRNPENYGLPTFENFSKNVGKYLGTDEDIFASIDNGSQMGLRGRLNKVSYEVEGHRSNSLERIYSVIRDYGIPFKDLDYQPQIIPCGGGKCDVLVKFLSKHDRSKRAAW
jgi:hypothetical protein